MTGTQTTFEHCFPPMADNLPVGRRALDQWLTGRSVDREIADDMSVVYSELTANALAATDGHNICTRAWIDDGELVLEVANGLSPGSDRRVTRWDLDDPLRPGGRGLLIVRAFTDEIEVVSSKDGQRIVVRCRRRLV